jgi:hypothetical protein
MLGTLQTVVDLNGRVVLPSSAAGVPFRLRSPTFLLYSGFSYRSGLLTVSRTANAAHTDSVTMAIA